MQALKAGETIVLDDGRVVNGADYLGEPIPGKVVAIFGDTQPTEQALSLRNADVMIHETTLEAEFAQKPIAWPLTTVQAAELARAAGVKRFIATHISGRYVSEDIPRLLAECQSVFPATEIAEDYLTVKI